MATDANERAGAGGLVWQRRDRKDALIFVVFMLGALAMIGGGFAAIRYRRQMVHTSVRAQRKYFGDWIRPFQRGETPGSMMIAGIGMIASGVWVIVSGFLNLWFPAS